jgi:uncharacterized protein (TIGR02271 family)
MFGREEIHEGMTVRSREGEKLGRVDVIEEDDFIIEKGIFFKREYVVLYDDVLDVREGDVILRSDVEALRPNRDDDSARASESAPVTARSGASETLRVPVVEEELEISKRDREVGAVEVRKEVVEETRTVEVPIRREVVHVERAAVTPAQELPAGQDAPASAEVRVPIHEEEITVSKRPVVKEEVRVSTDVVEERRPVSEEVRREEVSVTGDGEEEKSRRDAPVIDPLDRR